MIGFIPLQGTTAIKGKFACAPSTDMRNTDAVAVCFMLRNVLDAVLSPHLNLLLFRRCLLTLEVQVLENNYISRIENRKFYNGRGNLFGQLIIDAFGICPKIMCLARTVQSLKLLNAIEHMIQMVFVTCKIDKLSCKDSSICGHDTASCVCIKTQIDCTDSLLFDRRFTKGYIFLKRKAQAVFTETLFEYRRRGASVHPIFAQIGNIGFTQSDSGPHPVAFMVDFQVNRMFVI